GQVDGVDVGEVRLVDGDHLHVVEEAVLVDAARREAEHVDGPDVGGGAGAEPLEVAPQGAARVAGDQRSGAVGQVELELGVPCGRVVRVGHGYVEVADAVLEVDVEDRDDPLAGGGVVVDARVGDQVGEAEQRVRHPGEKVTERLSRAGDAVG